MASQGATVQSEILKLGWGRVTATDIQEHKGQIQELTDLSLSERNGQHRGPWDPAVRELSGKEP